MKALILVGGYGTRLRPLTLTRPKPLVEFCNKEILFRQMEALIEADVDTIILAVSYMCEMLEIKIKEFSENKHIRVIFSKEDEPLGTGGPIALARKYLDDGNPFFVLNSDVTCLYPFRQMLHYHKKKGALGTISVTKVEEPSKYGVIVSDDEGKILKFVEKPSIFISNRINAGIYVLDTEVLDLIEVRPTSIEREIFPKIAHSDKLYSYDMEGFWMDIGQPRDFLYASRMFIQHLSNNFPEMLGSIRNSHVKGMIHPSAQIGLNCKINQDVVVGRNVRIGEGVCLSNCVILSDCVIKSHSYIENSLIGWRCFIGRWVRIQEYTVLGEDVNVKDEVFINGARILPHKSITESLYDCEIVM